MKAKAAGLDGVSAQMLLALPDGALGRLWDLYASCEQGCALPVGWMKRSIAFLPKEHMTVAAPDMYYRPIAIDAIADRNQASFRAVGAVWPSTWWWSPHS